MKNRLTFVMIFMLTIITLNVLGQDSVRFNPYFQKPKSDFSQRLYFGGSLGLVFGSYTSISLWPLVGYKVTPKMSFGIQPGYEFISYDYYGYDFTSNNFGIRFFNRFRFIEQAFTHAEFAYIKYDVPWINQVTNEVETDSYWVPFLFLGGGYVQSVGGAGSVYFQVLFDVINDENSPYNSWEPFYTIGFGVGF